MSSRKTILRELNQLHAGEGNGRYTRPSAMRGFGQDPSRYQRAVSGLLEERLIEGKKDEEGRVVIALNPGRLATVQRELRPWFARPTIWLGAIVVAALVAALFVI